MQGGLTASGKLKPGIHKGVADNIALIGNDSTGRTGDKCNCAAQGKPHMRNQHHIVFGRRMIF